MKNICRAFITLYVAVLCASGALALDDQSAHSRGGVDAIVKYYPLGYNNEIVAYVRFVNKNDYAVNVDWTPTITCKDGSVRKGHGAGFTLGEGQSYVVNIWRSEACMQMPLKVISVDMDVKKASP